MIASVNYQLVIGIVKMFFIFRNQLSYKIYHLIEYNLDYNMQLNLFSKMIFIS